MIASYPHPGWRSHHGGTTVGPVGQFSYRLLKDGTVRIAHRGRHVVTLAGARAEAFRAALDAGHEEQLLMARVTGNFKRGNERLFKRGG
jgi:hypothetical protein